MHKVPTTRRGRKDGKPNTFCASLGTKIFLAHFARSYSNESFYLVSYNFNFNNASV